MMAAVQSGRLTMAAVKSELERIKQHYHEVALRTFCEEYAIKEKYEQCMHPLEHVEKYKMPTSVVDMVRFTDNLVYYRKKMIESGERKPVEPLVFINRAPDDGVNVPDESYKLTRAY